MTAVDWWTGLTHDATRTLAYTAWIGAAMFAPSIAREIRRIVKEEGQR